MNNFDKLSRIAIDLLKDLIKEKSFSKEEDHTANIIENFFKEKNIPANRKENNVWAKNKHFDNNKKTVLLNSHHDTVKPNTDWTKDPFIPTIENGTLFGLGSNDAGGALVSLIITFLHFYETKDLPFNIIIVASAEEEISGKNGIELIIPKLGEIDFAIVGEPTNMEMAIAEKGLMVLDCIAKGKSGHAARNEGNNAIYNAMKDIAWFNTFKFEDESKWLGPIKMSVTMIESGTQHNVVPDECKFVVDVRTTDILPNERLLGKIKKEVSCEVNARSTRLNPSGIKATHPIINVAKNLNIKTYGSPTLSDQALMPFDSVKIGPGKSERSHTADEFIQTEEIENGINTYIKILEHLNI